MDPIPLQPFRQNAALSPCRESSQTNYCNYPSCSRNCGFSLAADKGFAKNPSPERPPQRAARQSPAMRRGEPPTSLGLLSQRSTQPRQKPRGGQSLSGQRQAKRHGGRGNSLMPAALACEGTKCWAGIWDRGSIAQFSCLSAAFLLLRCRQLASKNTRCCHAVLPVRARKQLSVQFFTHAVMLPLPGLSPAAFLCLVGDSLSGTTAITRHPAKGARWEYAALGKFLLALLKPAKA